MRSTACCDARHGTPRSPPACRAARWPTAAQPRDTRCARPQVRGWASEPSGTTLRSQLPFASAPSSHAWLEKPAACRLAGCAQAPAAWPRLDPQLHARAWALGCRPTRASSFTQRRCTTTCGGWMRSFGCALGGARPLPHCRLFLSGLAAVCQPFWFCCWRFMLSEGRPAVLRGGLRVACGRAACQPGMVLTSILSGRLHLNHRCHRVGGHA